MPVIRISQETWGRLKAHATPLEHTANDIVSTALDALDFAKRRRASPAPLPKKVEQRHTRRYSQKELRLFLLETLYGLGGDATTREVRQSAKRILRPTLTDADCELVANGVPRWWNAICTARSDLIIEGLLRGDSERGIWELSKQARDFLTARAGHVAHLRQRAGAVAPKGDSRAPKSPKQNNSMKTASNAVRHRVSRRTSASD
jgi:hypothetical protein